MLVLMMAVLVHEQPLTLVVIPDIQYYTDLRHKLFRLYWDPPTDNLTHIYTQQLQWVVSTQHRLNTRAVIFMGDLTQADAPEEWAAVRKGLRYLEAARPPVPYCLLQGDHDLGYEYTGVPPFMARKAAHRRSQVDGNVSSAVSAQPHWRGAYSSAHPVANSWYELGASSSLRPMLVICLEYRPRGMVLRWAAGVLGSHPGHDAIVVTHDYLNARNGTRSDYSRSNATQADGSNAVRGSDGEQLFQMLRRHPNVFLVLCGHDDGEGYLLSHGEHGQPIHQLMSNYQQWPDGGDGWLRYLQFFPERNELVVRSYNVLSREHNHSSDLTLTHCMRSRKACADAWRNESTADSAKGRGVWYSSRTAPGGSPSLLVSQSVTTTHLAGSSWPSHTLLFFSFVCVSVAASSVMITRARVVVS